MTTTKVIFCDCGGTCTFQGDVGDLDEYRCIDCGIVYPIAQDSKVQPIGNERLALLKVARIADIMAEFLHGVDLGGEGGSKLLSRLDSALKELNEVKN